MDVNEKIRHLLDEREWSEYRLAKAAGLSQSTISNLFIRNTVPSVATLQSICEGFGITLAQFFSANNTVELTDEQIRFFSKWSALTKEQKILINNLIDTMR
ncbi:MAG: helix-turn-helix transcriptional regulator [Clostridiales Family XIII bacterium]|jgi:transcriptional regulator with XRE-family HTH domain|nr:helix-turn-helix transcriptional regulator [Clostridiales Family XIII bacterium]